MVLFGAAAKGSPFTRPENCSPKFAFFPNIDILINI
jgi:hypothetical protein